MNRRRHQTCNSRLLVYSSSSFSPTVFVAKAVAPIILLLHLRLYATASIGVTTNNGPSSCFALGIMVLQLLSPPRVRSPCPVNLVYVQCAWKGPRSLKRVCIVFRESGRRHLYFGGARTSGRPRGSSCIIAFQSRYYNNSAGGLPPPAITHDHGEEVILRSR